MYQEYLAWFILWLILTFLIFPTVIPSSSVTYLKAVCAVLVFELLLIMICIVVYAGEWALETIFK